jgi:hypothetical protein
LVSFVFGLDLFLFVLVCLLSPSPASPLSRLQVCAYRPFAHSFAPLPSHSNVVVLLNDRWHLLDVATVDMIDGFLDVQVGMTLGE